MRQRLAVPFPNACATTAPLGQSTKNGVHARVLHFDQPIEEQIFDPLKIAVNRRPQMGEPASEICTG